MRVLSRDFTFREKVLLVILALLIFGLGYYYLLDQPVRRELARCETEQARLDAELEQVNAKLHTLETMREELENIEASGDVSEMKSYNASKEEIKLLNDVLSRTDQYAITFSSVTRDGDQIRRNFTLEFSASNYANMADILSALAESPLRCRVSEIECKRTSRYNFFYQSYDYTEEPYLVTATATFYETMVGGTPDAGLPPDSKTSK